MPALPIQITFLNLVQTSALILCLRSTSSKPMPFIVAAQRLPACPLHQNFSRTSMAHASTAQNHSRRRKDSSCMPTLQPSQLPPAFSPCKNWPVSFGCSPQSLEAGHVVPHCLYNSKLTQAASMLAHFDWAVYGFNSGHFLSTIKEHGYPFHVVLACNPFINGRALFWELTLCSPIHSSAASLLDHVQALGITSKLTGYLIHSHCYYSSKQTKQFWELQCQLSSNFGSYNHF
jgi:hypothetical protein